MIGSILATIAALSGQNAETAKPKVDRSGEAAFRAMLAEIGENQTYHGLILRSVRDSELQDYRPDGAVEIWREGNKLRVEFGDLYNTSFTLVTDGREVIEDDGKHSVILRDFVELPSELGQLLSPQGTASSPWFDLMEGTTLLDRLELSEAITSNVDTASVRWSSPSFGVVSLVKAESDEQLIVWEMEFDHPGQSAATNASSNRRQKVLLNPTNHFPHGTFSVKPAKGKFVRDMRRTKDA